MIDISSEGETLEACAAVLQEVFGYEAFRGPQAGIVTHVSEGGDALVLMPTGGGKSLCYQIPAIVRQRAGHGVSIVVSPLIALMHDQVGALLEAGVDIERLNSVVFFRYLQSAIKFYQMVGRGTRIHEETQKYKFWLYDYTDATRLFGTDFITPPPRPGGGGDKGGSGGGGGGDVVEFAILEEQPQAGFHQRLEHAPQLLRRAVHLIDGSIHLGLYLLQAVRADHLADGLLGLEELVDIGLGKADGLGQIRDHGHFANEVGKIERAAFGYLLVKFPGEEHADNLVGIAASDRDARMRDLAQLLAALVGQTLVLLRAHGLPAFARLVDQGFDDLRIQRVGDVRAHADAIVTEHLFHQGMGKKSGEHASGGGVGK